MEKKLDIIIPAYNAHSTLMRTLCSVGMQTIASKIKVTIVNDCSPDGDYQQIIEKFQGHLDIQELILEENGGPGVAKQYGLDHTECPYIFFLDADDTLTNAFVLQYMLHGIEENKACEIYGDWFIESEHQALIPMDTNKKGMGVNGRIYSREFLDRFGIKFNTARIHEDSFFARRVEYYLQLYNLPALHFEEKVMIYHYTPRSICKGLPDDDYDFIIIKAWFTNIKELILTLEKEKAQLDDFKVSCLVEMYVDYNYFYRTQRHHIPELIQLQQDFFHSVYHTIPTIDDCMKKWDMISTNKEVVLIDNEVREIVPPVLSFEDYMQLLQGE